jgi:hypothetical protein
MKASLAIPDDRKVRVAFMLGLYKFAGFPTPKVCRKCGLIQDEKPYAEIRCSCKAT